MNVIGDGSEIDYGEVPKIMHNTVIFKDNLRTVPEILLVSFTTAAPGRFSLNPYLFTRFS